MAWLHLPAVLWGASVEFFGLICPLTPLEQRLREMAGQQNYTGGFVEQYLVPVMYPAGLTPTIQLGLGAFVVVLNVAIYRLSSCAGGDTRCTRLGDVSPDDIVRTPRPVRRA